MPAPEVTVVVPAHRRPMRLKWLLDALAEQTLARSRFEAVVAHDSDDAEVERVARTHPLAREGVLRAISCPPTVAAVKRNAGWRAARAPLVAFTDDDCRPAPRWLEQLLRASAEHPGAIVEGRTRPDPREAHHLGRPYARSIDFDPPTPWAATCNIAYPREVLERLDGLDQAYRGSGEDTDLMLRALELGAGHVGAPEALVWHTVDPGSLRARLRTLPRWQHLPLVIRRHPQVRRELMTLRVFWKPSHVRLLPALTGLALAGATRRPFWLLLVLPWLEMRAPRYGKSPRALAAAARDTPGQFVIDVAELGVMIRGSIRYRTFML